MGWCHEFGPQIQAGCDHPMTVRGQECGCDVCGVTCAGRYGGCALVWARNRPVRLRTRATVAGRAPVEVAGSAPPSEAPAAPAEPAPVSVEATIDAKLRPLLDEIRETSSPGAWADRVAASIGAVLVPLLQQATSDPGAVNAPPPAELEPAQSFTMRKALADIRSAAADLNAELVRLRAFRSALTADMPAVAAAIDSAAGRAGNRLRQAATELDGLRPYVPGIPEIDDPPPAPPTPPLSDGPSF